MAKYDFDIFIIGEGSAGLTAVKVATGLGKRTAMADSGPLGGECTWTGCVPSKALLKSAGAYASVNSLEKLGIKLSPAKISLKTDAVFKKVRDISEEVYNGHPPSMYEESGVTVYENTGVEFIDSHTLNVGGRRITSSKIIIAAGSSPSIPPIPGLAEAGYRTNQTIFEIKKLPASIVIIGGGAIGAEMATAFRQLGSDVTVIDSAERILSREDIEISEFIAGRMRSSGINLLTGVSILSVTGKKGKTVTVESAGVKKTLRAEELLIAAGRKPNTDGLHLEKAGVKYTKSGITVDSYLRTSVPHIYACGDITGMYQFSHIAGYQASLAAANAILPFKRKADYSSVPWITFTSPEAARSGLTEKEARELHGSRIRVYRVSYSALDRAVTDRTTEGFAKVITDRKGGILGIHITGERAGEVMHELHTAKTVGIPLHKLQRVIHAYPSYSDIVKYMARDALIDRIRNNPVVKLISIIRGRK